MNNRECASRPGPRVFRKTASGNTPQLSFTPRHGHHVWMRRPASRARLPVLDHLDIPSPRLSPWFSLAVLAAQKTFYTEEQHEHQTRVQIIALLERQSGELVGFEKAYDYPFFRERGDRLSIRFLRFDLTQTGSHGVYCSWRWSGARQPNVAWLGPTKKQRKRKPADRLRVVDHW